MSLPTLGAGFSGPRHKKEIIRPNSNVNTVWFVPSYVGVDEDVKQPAEGDGQFAAAIMGAIPQTQKWGLAAPSADASTVVSSVDVWIRSSVTAGSKSVPIVVKVGGVELPAQNIDVTTTTQYDSVAFSGDWTVADFAAAELHVTAPVDGGEAYAVYVAYAELQFG